MKKRTFLLLPLLALLFVFAKCKDDDKMVALPEAVKNYISDKYPGYDVDESEQETSCTGTTVYDVTLEKGKTEVELTFDAEGSFLYSESDIQPSDLPQAVKDGIAANYAGFSTEEASRMDMADGSKQYEVELKNGAAQKEVLLTEGGTVICEAEGDGDEDDDE